MSIRYLEYKELAQISEMDRRYACDRQDLEEFYQYEPTLASFEDIIRAKAKENTDRELLVSVLQSQYEQMGLLDEDSRKRIDQLREPNCFTVTTAHQPSLLTGPLYYVYKAFSAISLADKVSNHLPEYQVQAIFVLGGEDHDFDEINHFHYRGRIEWNRAATGAVGRLDLQGFEAVLEQVADRDVKHSNARDFVDKLTQFYRASSSYGDFSQRMTIELLGRYGILVLNMDDARFKRAMIEPFKEEIFQQPSLPLVQETQRQLREKGLSNQAFPRAINLFYLTENVRERIEQEGDSFEVLNTDLSFSAAALERELEDHPDRFSPNVVFRPIFQETILPNLAYVGGGGELAYWLERKSQFVHFGLNFPMLVRRDSAIWLSTRDQRKIQKLQVSIPELGQREETLINTFVQKWATADFSITEESEAIGKLFDQLAEKGTAIEAGLGPMVLAQKAYHLKRLAHLGGKLRKAEKAKHHVRLESLIALRSSVFPGGNLQERYLNFLNIYEEEGDAFFEDLLKHFDPLDTRVKVLYQK
ncbi:MAG: bacillithiol biosynthesis cysteine-adding enzyme BshC [Saprospiraceae bacterium]|nr:bacillithiol biosynthesis cysteine-adding enzyme BshC [Saprospiraceae bacterium]